MVSVWRPFWSLIGLNTQRKDGTGRQNYLQVAFGEVGKAKALLPTALQHGIVSAKSCAQVYIPAKKLVQGV